MGACWRDVPQAAGEVSPAEEVGEGEILPRASVVAAPWQIQPGAGALLCQPWEEEQQRCSEPTDPIEKVRRVAEAGHGVQQVATRPVRVASSAAGSLPVPPQPAGTEVGSAQPETPRAPQRSMAPLGEAGANAKLIWVCFAHC